MNLHPKHALMASALIFVSACGGGESENTTQPENTVQTPAVTEATSTPTEAPAPAETVETAASEAFAALPEPYKSADYNRGRRTFKLCQSCHTIAEGGPNLVGPNLYGMFGREIGAVEGFGYSKAIEESDIVWTPEILSQWLESPRNFLPGNRMSFAGVRKDEDRTAVIAYIMSETGYVAE
ncbi:MAG: cytochrome c family protein [Pseudomonadota bacterium]